MKTKLHLQLNTTPIFNVFVKISYFIALNHYQLAFFDAANKALICCTKTVVTRIKTYLEVQNYVPASLARFGMSHFQLILLHRELT